MPNIPATTSSRAANEPERARSANSRSGVIGCAARVSFSTNVTSSTAATANAARATWLPQPSDAALMKA